MLMMRRSDFSLMMTMELMVCFWNSNVDGSAVEAFSLFPDGDDPLNAMLDNDELICDISDNDEAYGMFIEDNGGPKGTGCQCHQVDHDDPLVLESDFAKKLDEAGIGYTEHQDQNLWNMGGATGSATQIMPSWMHLCQESRVPTRFRIRALRKALIGQTVLVSLAD